mgnify:CR=1 FL=1
MSWTNVSCSSSAAQSRHHKYARAQGVGLLAALGVGACRAEYQCCWVIAAGKGHVAAADARSRCPLLLICCMSLRPAGNAYALQEMSTILSAWLQGSRVSAELPTSGTWLAAYINFFRSCNPLCRQDRCGTGSLPPEDWHQQRCVQGTGSGNTNSSSNGRGVRGVRVVPLC